MSTGHEGMTRNHTQSSRWNIGRTDASLTCGLMRFLCNSSHSPNQNGIWGLVKKQDTGSLSSWLAWEKSKTWQPEAGHVPLRLRSGSRAITTGRRETDVVTGRRLGEHLVRRSKRERHQSSHWGSVDYGPSGLLKWSTDTPNRWRNFPISLGIIYQHTLMPA